MCLCPLAIVLSSLLNAADAVCAAFIYGSFDLQRSQICLLARGDSVAFDGLLYGLVVGPFGLMPIVSVLWLPDGGRSPFFLLFPYEMRESLFAQMWSKLKPLVRECCQFQGSE